MQSLECLTLFRGPPPRSPEQGGHHSPHSKYGPRSGSLGPRLEEGEGRRSQELSSFRWKERVDQTMTRRGRAAVLCRNPLQ